MISSALKGLRMKSSAPAARMAILSSSNAFAVTATIRVEGCGFWLLIDRVASSPFIFGMQMSIKMRSGCQSRQQAMASSPSVASWTRKPHCFSNAHRISRFTARSSTTRTFRSEHDRRLNCSAFASLVTWLDSSFAGCRSISNEKHDPWPTVLSTISSPPKSCTNFWLMFTPRPVPSLLCRPICVCWNAPNRSSNSSGAIPAPVSWTANDKRLVRSATVATLNFTDPTLVNLMELLRKLIKICLSFISSV
mmetsp:Transcript_3355/g.6377  ORF Transcript_3355/g.6377 Transcript_3355/m.6377 type:complete len:250 (+) Transcript_3355:369-1118(+)